MALGFRSSGTSASGRRHRLASLATAVLLVAAAVGAFVSLTGFDDVKTAQASSAVGYWVAGRDGRVQAHGSAPSLGSATSARPVVGIAATPTGLGYWLVADDGGIFSFGDAAFFGSTGAIALNRPIVGMAATPSGHGYWLVADDGGIFAFGDAAFFGSTGAIHLNRPIVGMAPTPSGHGYWLVADDGGIFAFGDATFFGSTGAIHLNRPIVGMTATPTGQGYWLVADDGGIFSFGDAGFVGGTGGLALSRPIVAMTRTPSGDGYWLVADDGGIFSFGDATFLGATAFGPGGVAGLTAVAVTPATTSTTTSGPSATGPVSSGPTSTTSGPTPTTSLPVPTGPGPSAANTGVPTGTTLTPSGSLTITQDGAIVQDLAINGSIFVDANDVTIRRTRVTTTDPYGIRLADTGRRLLVEDVEIVGQPGCEAGLAFQNYTAVRVDVHGCNDGMKIGDLTTVQDSFVHDYWFSPGSHNDGLQSTGGTGIRIQGNRILNPNSQTSCILLGEEEGPLDDALIEGNWLDGGNYTIYAGAGTTNPNITVRANRFGRTYVFGLISANPLAHYVWTGNVWDDTGQTAPDL